MLELRESLIFWFAFTTQSCGIITMILSRLNGCRSSQLRYQVAFYLCLVSIGSMMMAAVIFESGYWISFAITIAVMIIGTTLDLGHSRQQRVL